MTISFSISHMIIPTINYIPYEPFDLDQFFKDIPDITPGIDMVNIQMLDKIYHVYIYVYSFLKTMAANG